MEPSAASYSIYTSPSHAPLENHLPTLIVTPSGRPQHVLYTYLHTNYNQENYLLTPSPNGDLCVAKMFPSASITGASPSSSSSSSQGHGSPALSSSSASSHQSRSPSTSKEKSIRCEASRALRWSISNTGIAMPTYKLTLPSVDPSGSGDDQPLFQVSKTSRSAGWWTLWYYTYSGHLVPPKRIEFGRIEKAAAPDKKNPNAGGGGTRVMISGKTEAEKAVWKTLGEGNEDMVEWIVLCAALNVLDDEIREAMKTAGTPLRPPPSTAKPRHHSSGSGSGHQLHPTGYHDDRQPNPRPGPSNGPPERPQRQNSLEGALNGLAINNSGRAPSPHASNGQASQQYRNQPPLRDPREEQPRQPRPGDMRDMRQMSDRPSMDPRDPRQQLQQQQVPYPDQRQQQLQQMPPNSRQQSAPNFDPRAFQEQRRPPEPRALFPDGRTPGQDLGRPPPQDPRMQAQDPRMQDPRMRAESRGPSPDPRQLLQQSRSKSSSPAPPPMQDPELSSLPYDSPAPENWRPGPGQAQSGPIPRPRLPSNNGPQNGGKPYPIQTSLGPPLDYPRSPNQNSFSRNGDYRPPSPLLPPPSPGRQRVESGSGDYVPGRSRRPTQSPTHSPQDQQPPNRIPQNPADFMRQQESFRGPPGPNGPRPAPDAYGSVEPQQPRRGTQLQDINLSRQG